MLKSGARAIDGALQPFEERVSERGRSVLDEFARDPFKLADEGYVFIEDLVTGRPVQLRLYDHEREMLTAWIDLDYLHETGNLQFRTVHLEKSRRMGASWTLAYGCLWAISHHGVSGLVMARREIDVDDGGEGSTTASFLGRMRYMATYPTFPRHLSDSLWFTHRLVRNRLRPEGYLRGESGIPDPGRGLGLDFAIIDEAARVERGESVHASLSRACPEGRFYNSTPFGRSNMYYRLRSRRLPGYEYLRLHWSLHPVFGKGQHVAGMDETCDLCAGNIAGMVWEPDEQSCHRYPGKLASPWYDLAVTELTDEQVAMELDIDYAGSLTARVFPEFSREVHVAERPIAFDPKLRISDGWDYGWSPSFTSVVACQETVNELRVFAEYECRGLTPDEVATGYRAALRAKGVPDVLLDKKWTVRHESIGDPSGEATEIGSGRSVVQEYRAQGFAITSKSFPRLATITAVKRLLRGLPKKLIVSPDNVKFIEHIEESRWPTDRDGIVKPNAKEPVNDEHWHMMSAMRYLACLKFPPPEIEQALAIATRGRRADDRGIHDPSIRYGMEF